MIDDRGLVPGRPPWAPPIGKQCTKTNLRLKVLRIRKSIHDSHHFITFQDERRRFGDQVVASDTQDRQRLGDGQMPVRLDGLHHAYSEPLPHLEARYQIGERTFTGKFHS